MTKTLALTLHCRVRRIVKPWLFAQVILLKLRLIKTASVPSWALHVWAEDA